MTAQAKALPSVLWSEESEQIVLGGMMLDQALAHDLYDIAAPEQFANETHRTIARTITTLLERGIPADPVAVFNALGTADRSLAPYLHTCYAAVPHAPSARHHARIVAEYAHRRLADDAALRFRQRVANRVDLDGAISDLRAELDPVALASSGHDNPPRSALEALANPPEVPMAYMSPSVIVPGDITLIAAPTKVGKTFLWLHFAWALSSGSTLFGLLDVPAPIPVLMLQLELPEWALVGRIAELRGPLGWSDDALERFCYNCRRISIDTPKGSTDLRRTIEACEPQPRVLILDSYNKAVAGDPDSTEDARRALDALYRVISACPGLAILLTCEVRKLPAGVPRRWAIDDLKGNNEVAYDAATVIFLRPLDDPPHHSLAVQFEAMRHAEPPESFTLTREGMLFRAAPDAPIERRAVELRAELEERVEKVAAVVAEQGPVSKREIRRLVAGRAAAVDQALDYALRLGHVEWSPKGYILPLGGSA